MSKGYIYILTNPSFPDYVKIGYADDVNKRLQQLNRSECVPFAFRVFATYEVSSRLSDVKIHEIIDRRNPDLRAIENFDGKKRVREFYAMTAEDAYGLLKSIAEINGMEDNLKLIKPSQEEIKQEQIAEEIEQKSRGEIFSFTKCQIPVGAELVYINDENIKCYVVDDRKIKYHDEVMYMTTLAKMLTGKKVGIAGPAFFKYNGENLQYYYDLYQSKRSNN